MIGFVKHLVQKHNCQHFWKEQCHWLYYDIWGNKVLAVKSRCIKCGKKKVKRYWDDWRNAI